LKKLYIDIDGVLLTTKHTTAANFATQFIDFITIHFECYWLTTHCKGNISNPLSYLTEYFDTATIEKLRTLKPTNWATLKTEAIDFSSDFIWLDDNPFIAEINILTTNFANDKLIIVNLDNKNELKSIMKILNTRI
jgi:hypothetical protein